MPCTTIFEMLMLGISMSASAACFNAGGNKGLADEANNASSFAVHRSLRW